MNKEEFIYNGFIKTGSIEKVGVTVVELMALGSLLGTGAGSLAGYKLSKKNKLRNSIIGGVAGGITGGIAPMSLIYM